MKKIKNIISVIVFAVFLVATSFVCLSKPADAFSDAERRELAQFPEINAETVATGEFSRSFESYTTDQFPKRDLLRSMKAFFSRYALGKAENNGLFFADGHLSKIDSAENEEMMNHAAKRFGYIYDTYLSDSNVYFSIVPDKNRYLAKNNGYPSLDYEGFVDRMRAKVDFMEYIDISQLLELSDYYRTDTHWRQEAITDVEKHLASAMGKDINGGSYEEKSTGIPFYGVYSGQYAMHVFPDELKYLTNDTIDNAIVTYYDTGMPKAGKMYNMEKAQGKDPYEMFLSGTMPLVTLERANSTGKNHLILFRDSFGSAIAPLFLEAYDKVTVIDTRYVQSEFLKSFGIEFSGADVLFLYSTSLLNNSLAIR